MKVETAKTGLILLLMAYAIETWPWVEKSFQAQEIIDADAKLRSGVRQALEEAYQESKAGQAQDPEWLRAEEQRIRDGQLADTGAKLRDLGLRRMEGEQAR